MASWADLAALRQAGKRPRFPVVIALRARTGLAAAGMLVIEHEAGTPMPVDLLAGLEVWLMLGSCDRAVAVTRALKARGVQPASLRTWCECSQSLEAFPVGCETAAQFAALRAA